jgi:sialic acid synthase SpsE
MDSNAKKGPISGMVDLESKKVGQGESVYFIAEIGNNHNGDYFIAKRSIEEAAKAGAHAVKFQKRFISETFAKELYEKPQTNGEIKGETYGEYREGLELSLEEFTSLKDVAKENGVSFFATPFDKKSVDFLEEVGVPFYKIASFDLTNLPLLDYVARLNKPLILSTGMATYEEVEEAVATVTKHHEQLILLHCVSVYPSPDADVHLGAMKMLMEKFGRFPIGYSGHEGDMLPSLVAVAQGATIIERHFTLSRYLPGPDHASVSIEPPVFKEMVDQSQRISLICGKKEKVLHKAECKARDKHSKSLVTKVSLPKGTVITEDVLTVKSPGYGVKPKDLNKVIGKRTIVDVGSDVVLRLDDLQ